MEKSDEGAPNHNERSCDCLMDMGEIKTSHRKSRGSVKAEINFEHCSFVLNERGRAACRTIMKHYSHDKSRISPSFVNFSVKENVYPEILALLLAIVSDKNNQEKRT